MSKLKPSQALGMWALTAFILFLLASLFSWSISDWNWFSKILFWGPTIILGVWTVNDYFINPDK
jgi:phosphatidylglycerophosphate synthase